jgi:hypothetical protein
MINDGLFERFPCNSIFSMHNWLPRCPGWVETSSPCLSILRFLLGSVSQFG